MNILQRIMLVESQQAAQKELLHSINVINTCYSEWKKRGRRKNAVDIITTTANKLSSLDVNIVKNIHPAGKQKLVIMLLRCMDIPTWKDVETRGKIYKKLFKLIDLLQNEHSTTDTSSTLKQAILTRLSGAISKKSESKVFVAYEPVVPKELLNYIFGDELPVKTYKFEFIGLSDDFDNVISQLTINHEKAENRFKSQQSQND